jgi:hypothetical protein
LSEGTATAIRIRLIAEISINSRLSISNLTYSEGSFAIAENRDKLV